MTQSTPNWSQVRLVIFDVDGTLYAQRPLRLKMAAELALNSMRRFGFSDARILSFYRRAREAMGDAELEHFESALIEKTALATGKSPAQVHSVIAEWIERRPLRHLADSAYPQIDRLFDRIRTSGRRIGVLSDYPARAKLAAMRLEADHIVSAGDVGMLKPDPRGLLQLMAEAGCLPHQTVMIGDRPDRDGEAARRAGVTALIRSNKALRGWQSFARYDDPIFDGLAEAVSSRESDLWAA